MLVGTCQSVQSLQSFESQFEFESALPGPLRVLQSTNSLEEYPGYWVCDRNPQLEQLVVVVLLDSASWDANRFY